MHSINIGYFYAVVTGVLTGTIPIIFQKALLQTPIPRATALFIKLASSSLILLPLMIPRIKNMQFPRRLCQKIPVASFFYVATLVFLYESYNHIPTGIGIALHYTFPLFTMIFNVVLYRFRCTKQSVLAMLLSLVGVAFLSSGSLSIGGEPVGILLALSSAVAYAAYFLWVERAGLASLDAMVFVTVKTCGASVLMFLYILITRQLTFSVSALSFCVLLLSGVVTILASFCLTMAIRHIGSVHASILGSVEPIVCAVAGVLFLGESIGLKSGIGIAMVLISAAMVTLSKREKGK